MQINILIIRGKLTAQLAGQLETLVSGWGTFLFDSYLLLSRLRTGKDQYPPTRVNTLPQG